MKLIECYIENFGKLTDLKIGFKDGLNSIKEDNGYGKTTLTVFIKAMLFGLDDTRSKKLESNERKHYMPWQGGRAGGSLTFETNGKKYRIERTFMPKAAEDTFKLYDSRSGKESFDFSENIGEELFGIDADGFERTVFLSEANLSGKNENKTVSAKLSDLVGYDGDLSVMDDAIELLEKERKIYYKRGGSGEIGEMKSALSTVERKINDLERMSEEYEKEKLHHTKITEELLKAKESKSEYLQKTKVAEQSRLKEAYLKQYMQMKNSLESDKEREKTFADFFKYGVPSHEDIDEARELYAESKRLTEKNIYSESAEFTLLSDFFKTETSNEEYEDAKRLLSSLESKKTELRLIKEELSAHEDNSANLKSKSGRWIFLALGLSLTVIGVILAALTTYLALSLSAVGIILSLIGFKAKTGNKSAKGKLNAIAVKQNKIDTVTGEIKNIEDKARIFISRFPVQNNNTVEEALREILRKRDMYSVFASSQKALLDKSKQNELLSEEYYKRAAAFLSHFHTVSTRPFDEIKNNLLEYEAIKASIAKSEAMIERFMLEHGITADDTKNKQAEIEPLTMNFDYAEIDSAITALEKEKTLSERRLSEIFEEIDRLDELTAEKERLGENIDVLERRLSVIQKTKSYLAEAKDLITSKYLSKTKTAFAKYIDAIGNEKSESFNINTSFEIMKSERGTLREAGAYSKGTRDLYALAARLALIDSLYENESPFIILDDPFAHFDDDKLKNALSMLRSISKYRQIIYITCTDARKV